MSRPEVGNGAIAANTLLFVHILRAIGIPVGLDRTAEFVTALSMIDLRNRRDVYYAARALFLIDPGKLGEFDRAFDRFWRFHRPEGQMAIRTPASGRGSAGAMDEWSPPPGARAVSAARPQDDRPQQGNSQPVLFGRYSSAERLREVDFADLSSREQDEVDQAILRMTVAAGLKPARRYRRGAGNRLDLPQILRSGIRWGGEWLELSYRRKKQVTRNLIVFLDVSGSMSSYAERYLQLSYVLSRRWPSRVEVFALGTRLTRLSHALHEPTSSAALREVSRRIVDWGGGTRIGETLRAFHIGWAARTSAGAPVTVLVSDGWDRGDIEMLEREMARLARGSHRLLWMNPLMDRPGYEPRTRALLAVERYVDAFLPAGTLASLERAVRVIERASAARADAFRSDPEFLNRATPS